MTTQVPVEHALYLAAGLFALGLIGILVRRNLIFILMSLEVMLNGVGLAFIAGGARWGQADGQILFLLILTLAAAEAAVGLALVLAVHHRLRSLDADVLSRMRG
jgi:NADH-quinone oxidoreductase subunit K